VSLPTRSIGFDLIIAAQFFVDAWLRNPKRGPFARAVAVAESRHHGALSENERRMGTFGKVADAIRLGRGHAFNNPAPLRAIVGRAAI
jgi:hypothetical protein